MNERMRNGREEEYWKRKIDEEQKRRV